MVKHVAIALALMTSVAAAEAVDPGDYVETEVEPNPAFNMFGFRFSAGALPIEGSRTIVLAVGLGVEHPVFKKTRVFGEYEWLWLSRQDERDIYSVVPRPERHGNGHRTSLGLRRELLGKSMGGKVRLFVDGEIGANIALVDDNMSGVSFMPGGLAGLRFGYDAYSSSDDSPSRTFEIEMLVRMIVIEGGAGASVGMGMYWGN